MSRNSESEAVSSSPNLINSLRNFRFEKKTSPYNLPQASSNSPQNSNRVLSVPDTPENHQRKIPSCITAKNLERAFKTHSKSGTSLRIVLPNKSVTITAISSSSDSTKNPSPHCGPLFIQQKTSTTDTELPKKAVTGTVSTQSKSDNLPPNSKDSHDCSSSNVVKGTSSVAPQAAKRLVPKAQESKPQENKPHNSLDSTETTKVKEPAMNIETHRRAAMDDYDVFSVKEQSLRKVLKVFPDADIMEAQDLLVSCGWNTELAIETAHKKPLRTISRRRSVPVNFVGNSSDLGKGIVFEPETASIESMLTITDVKGNVTESIAEEIVLDDSEDSCDASKPNSSGAQENSVSSIQSNDSGKKRVLSDDELSDDASSKRAKRICVNDEENSLSDNGKSDSVSEANSSRQPSPSVDKSEKCIDSNSGVKQINISDAAKINSNACTSSKQLTNTANSKMLPKKAVGDSSVGKNPESTHINDTTLKKIVKKKGNYESEDDDEEEFEESTVYDSDDSDTGEGLTPARQAVLSFFQDATVEELTTVPGCSKKKVEIIIKYRPFENWVDLVCKLDSEKSLSTELLNGAKKVLDMRTAVNRIMTKCHKIAAGMEDLVESLKVCKEEYKDYVTEQPALLNSKMHLAPYQMLGLNWLILMHTQEVNGILADEMGLGKTVQAIALLAYLKEQKVELPHLIVVPSSTLDNWKKELQIWWPTVSILCYHGSQDYRRELRLKILNGEMDEFDVVVTTYNMVTSSTEDKNFFKRLDFYFVIFDEAHMLKNMSSQRYQNLMRIHAQRRLLLTGTPLQNNLVELMSLLIFVMPDMFSNKTDHIKQMFSSVCKSDEGRSKFEKERIERAKGIMKPFVLRRLKSEVLQDLPAKEEETKFCPMTEFQRKQYSNLVTILSEEVLQPGSSVTKSYSQVSKVKNRKDLSSGTGMMMQLRKAANHPLLLRNYFNDTKLKAMSELITKEPPHKEANPVLVFEDMQVMSDFELHQLCKLYKSISSFQLSSEVILDSGKFVLLEALFPKLIKKGDRLLLFSQFTMMLDIIEEFMKIKKYRYLRLDGSVPVADRQILIDQYNGDPNIVVFLLSTRAGGLGINLTAANVVLLHDIDFNPYNDKQAEDRCHRVGQTRSVNVMRMISKDTIEEGMLQRAKEKLKLEKDITSSDADNEEEDCRGVATLLKNALGLSNEKR